MVQVWRDESVARIRPAVFRKAGRICHAVRLQRAAKIAIDRFAVIHFGTSIFDPWQACNSEAFLCGTRWNGALPMTLPSIPLKEDGMKKYLFVAATIGALAAPAMAEEVGVQVGPVGAGVTVGESHRDYDRDRVREKTVIKEREPSERTTVIKKERGDGVESKTIIRRDND
jgi:hypothetical protein